MLPIVRTSFQLCKKLTESVYARIQVHGTVSVADVIAHIYLVCSRGVEHIHIRTKHISHPLCINRNIFSRSRTVGELLAD